MIFFYSHGGRLGNQLFQTAMIEARRKPRELIVTTQMSDSKKLLKGLRGYNDISNPLLVNLIDHVISRFVARPLVNLRLVSSLTEKAGELCESHGILPITYIRGYFQSPRHFSTRPITADWIRPSFHEAASRHLEKAGTRCPVFVHVRRADYHTTRASALLPLAYYREAVGVLSRSVDDAHFFFLGDDPEWCKREFSEIRHKTFVTSTSYEDLALMSLCAGGVVSNSSFAWWGAFLCRKTVPIVAPLYWFGWRKKEWLPRGIEASEFRFIQVVVEDAGQRQGRSN